MNTPYKEIHWSFLDKLGAVAAVLSVLCTFAWFAIPTSVFIRSISMNIDDTRVTYVRELPFGEVTARWRAEVVLINGGGYECTSGQWSFAEYQPKPGNRVTYDIGDWAEKCIHAGPPFYLNMTRQVMLFGVIPLRPERQVTEIIGDRISGPVALSQGLNEE